MGDFDLFIMVVNMFGIKHNTFCTAGNFDTCVVFRDSENWANWMFYFDTDTGGMLQQSHLVRVD